MAQQHPGGGGYKVEAGVPATAADHDSVSSHIISLCHVYFFLLINGHLYVSGQAVAWLHFALESS